MTAGTATFDLAGYLAAERAEVEKALGRWGAHLAVAAPAVLARPIAYALEAGGKRLRPILCVAAYRAVAGEDEAPPEPVYELALATELIHTYSLIHDDLPCMDDDDLRRGRPATHVAFGEDRAIVAAAALIPLACDAVVRAGRRLGLEPARQVRLVAELCTAAGASGMVGGQWLDLEAEGRDITAAELKALHGRKTGALLAGAVRIGAIAAGASDAVLGALDAYGRAVGLAFQIADDLLDVTGRTADIGKSAGRDATLAKAAYPALLGVDGARRRARESVEFGIAALRESGAHSAALHALARYAVERDR